MNAPQELAGQCVRDELLALGADLARLSPSAQRVVGKGIDILVNGNGGPREAAAARPTKEGTSREHRSS